VQLQSRWNSSLMPSSSNWLEWTPLWCATRSNFAPTDSFSALAVPSLQNWESVQMDGNDQPSRQNKLLREMRRRVLQIGCWRWPLTLASDTPSPYFISHHLPARYMLHIFVPVGTHTFPHLLLPEALQRNNYTKCDECH
jgi:hypothetical protein